MTTNNRDGFYKLAPAFLTTGEGELVRYSCGLILDAFTKRANEAAMVRFPEYGPEDALRYAGRDRGIPRGIDEAAAAYATRLLDWLDDHRVRGNPYMLCKQIAGYCNAAVRVRTVDQAGNWFTRERDGAESVSFATANWNWNAAITTWARFWVIIYPTVGPPTEPWTATDTWGMGYKWGEPGRTWGTSATLDQVATVRSIVRNWRPDGTRCECIIIAFDDASFDPAAPEPDGDWQLWSTGDPRLKNRLATARYWAGTET